MALNKHHQTKIDMMNAFDVADRNTPRDSIGRASYSMGSGGLPRTHEWPPGSASRQVRAVLPIRHERFAG